MSRPSQDRPLLRLAVGAVDAVDDQRLKRVLLEIAGQDRPSVKINTQPKDGLYSLEGIAASDLDAICDRLREEYGIAINVSPPQALMIETIRREAEAEGKYIRQTGGLGNYGHCKLRIEPLEPNKGYEFINEMSDGAVPDEYIKAIEQGVLDAMKAGILAGHPLANVKVTLFDGSYHRVDSNEMAFKFAGLIAFKEAARKASPVVLEPMMAIELEVPENVARAIKNEILAHRGRIERHVTADGLSEMKAIVPLAELLSSASGGFTEVQMEFAGYEPVRDDRSSEEDGSGVTANKPNAPRPWSRSERAERPPEEE